MRLVALSGSPSSSRLGAENQTGISAIAKYSHEYYLSQKENLREAHKRYRHRHADEFYAKKRAFYAANRERLQAKQREYNAKNAKRRREFAKQDASRHLFRIRAANLKIRHEGQPTASKMELAGLWRKQKGICPFTGVRLNQHNAQLDHIIPVIRGGTGTVENLRWILRDANYAKRDLTDERFIALCEMVVNNTKKRS